VSFMRQRIGLVCQGFQSDVWRKHGQRHVIGPATLLSLTAFRIIGLRSGRRRGISIRQGRPSEKPMRQCVSEVTPA
jgi:hypothetical protein